MKCLEFNFKSFKQPQFSQRSSKKVMRRGVQTKNIDFKFLLKDQILTEKLCKYIFRSDIGSNNNQIDFLNPPLGTSLRKY